MSTTVENFLVDLRQELSIAASEEGNEKSLPEAFTEYMFGVLSEAGEVDDATAADYQSVGARASGYSVSEDESILWLFLTDFSGGITPTTLGKTDLSKHFRRMTTFLLRARDGLWKKLEESAPSWDMAQRIAEVWQKLAEIRLVVLTNCELKTQIPDASAIDGIQVVHSVWDLTRVHRLSTSGRAQEPIDVDFTQVGGAPIPCLGPKGQTGAYNSYLMMVPGELLAQIYAIYGPRLLELNVRSFLQARGKVNKGIQETLKTEPARFLAYNNGISMTAAEVELVTLDSGGRAISRIRDLQIVNGGQTTASLHYAKTKSRLDLSEVYVQAKLSVVIPDRLMDLVPRISEFANSQNKVNMADFSANDPFHVEIERLSRTVWVPGKNGSAEMTRWFYERARGQYADALARERTPARQKKFKTLHPPTQKFTKTDLAKYENTWDQLPWIVSLGAEKNFREFTIRLGNRGSSFRPDQDYYELLIAKAILFKSSEKLVGSLKLGGYRAQTVTYSLAKLLNVTGQTVDLSAVYRNQELSPAFVDEIIRLAPEVHSTILESAGSRNISEWAKKEGCWKTVLDLDWSVSDALSAELNVTSRRTKTTSEASLGEQLTSEEKEALDLAQSIDGDTFLALSKWAKETNSLTPWDRRFSFNFGKQRNSERTPTRKQAVQAARIVREARRLGFDA